MHETEGVGRIWASNATRRRRPSSLCRSRYVEPPRFLRRARRTPTVSNHTFQHLQANQQSQFSVGSTGNEVDLLPRNSTHNRC